MLNTYAIDIVAPSFPLIWLYTYIKLMFINSCTTDVFLETVSLRNIRTRIDDSSGVARIKWDRELKI